MLRFLVCLIVFMGTLISLAQSGFGGGGGWGGGKKGGGNVGALFAAGLGGSALGLSYGVLLANQGKGSKGGDHHHIYNYGFGGGGSGASDVQVINAGSAYGGYGGFGTGYGGIGGTYGGESHGRK